MCQVNPSPAREDVGHQYGTKSKTTPGCKHSTKASKAPPCDCAGVIIISLIFLACFLVCLGLDALDLDAPQPKFHIRLVLVEGLDSSTESPAFHLAVDVDGVSRSYRACSGGGNSMLRVSYHGMVLAWGRVPWFCVDGGRSRSRRCGVATVVAKTEGAVLRDDLRGLILSERRVLGKTEFDVEGEVARLGYLRVKVFLFDEANKNARATC